MDTTNTKRKRLSARLKPAKKIAKAAQVKDALDLAREGKSVRRIAAILGLPKSTVQRRLDTAYEDARPGPEQTEAYRREQRERIMAQLEVWIPRSLHKNDAAAARAVARFEERLAKLDGVDAPAKVDMTLATREIDEFIARAEKALPPDVFLQLVRFAAGEADAPEAAPSGVGASEGGEPHCEPDRDE